ncbi:hypothetical protein GQ600_24063 [Phytophthora cactorum]|nr:hypothetical protein GQ600_24063 [Phytophthora cactorum]
MLVCFILLAAATILKDHSETQNQVATDDSVSSIYTARFASDSKRLLRIGNTITKVIKYPKTVTIDQLLDAKHIDEIIDPKRADAILAKGPVGGRLDKKTLDEASGPSGASGQATPDQVWLYAFYWLQSTLNHPPVGTGAGPATLNVASGTLVGISGPPMRQPSLGAAIPSLEVHKVIGQQSQSVPAGSTHAATPAAGTLKPAGLDPIVKDPDGLDDFDRACTEVENGGSPENKPSEVEVEAKSEPGVVEDGVPPYARLFTPEELDDLENGEDSGLAMSIPQASRVTIAIEWPTTHFASTTQTLSRKQIPYLRATASPPTSPSPSSLSPAQLMSTASTSAASSSVGSSNASVFNADRDRHKCPSSACGSSAHTGNSTDRGEQAYCRRGLAPDAQVGPRQGGRRDHSRTFFSAPAGGLSSGARLRPSSRHLTQRVARRQRRPSPPPAAVLTTGKNPKALKTSKVSKARSTSSTAPLDGPSSPPRLDLGHLGGASATALATDATFPREAAVNTEDVGDSDDEYGGLPIALTTNITQSRSHGGTGQSSSSATAPFDIADFLSRPIQHPNIIRAAYAPAGALHFSNAQHILATYSAWFGRYGITIMHYLRADRAAQVRAGSSDANYSLDFSANVVPPQPPS